MSNEPTKTIDVHLEYLFEQQVKKNIEIITDAFRKHFGYDINPADPLLSKTKVGNIITVEYNGEKFVEFDTTPRYTFDKFDINKKVQEVSVSYTYREL